MNYADVRKKKFLDHLSMYFQRSVRALTWEVHRKHLGRQEESLFSRVEINNRRASFVQQIFGGNSATTARILLLLLFCLTSKAKEAAVQHVLRAAVSYRLGAPARPAAPPAN